MTSPFRHVTPVTSDNATGLVADVYRQVDTEFSSIGPAVMMLSGAPEILAATWALLRESLVVGRVPRWQKETVTVSVSHANRCAYDLAGHLVFLRLAGGDHIAEILARGGEPDDPDVGAIVRWARATATPHGRELATPPFAADLAPEYIGTALALHLINRLVIALLNKELLPGDMSEDVPAAFDSAPIARAIQQHRTAGDSVRLLRSTPAGPFPGWAGDSGTGPAYAALRAAATHARAGLSDAANEIIRAAIARHRGDNLDIGRSWLAEATTTIGRDEQPAARLAMLTALAPAAITDDDVALWRTDQHSDHDLLHLLAYGAMTAIELIESDIAHGHSNSGGDCQPAGRSGIGGQ